MEAYELTDSEVIWKRFLGTVTPDGSMFLTTGSGTPHRHTQRVLALQVVEEQYIPFFDFDVEPPKTIAEAVEQGYSIDTRIEYYPIVYLDGDVDCFPKHTQPYSLDSTD